MQIMECPPLGMSIGRLKQKMALNNATKEVVGDLLSNNFKGASSSLMVGLDKSPSKMVETLYQAITKLSAGEQKSLFANLSRSAKAIGTEFVESIQGKIDTEVGKSRQYVDYNMKKLYITAKQNGFDASQLVKR